MIEQFLHMRERVKNYSDPISIILSAGIAINTVLVVNSIVTENHTMAVINFLSGILLLFAYENRRNKDD